MAVLPLACRAKRYHDHGTSVAGSVMGEAVRRCAVLWLEPREVAHLDLTGLLQGGTGVAGSMHWFAHAPHLEAPVEVGEAELRVLGRANPNAWCEPAMLAGPGDARSLARLLEAGLLFARDDEGEAAMADARLREVGWHGTAALAHAATRWQAEQSGDGLAAPLEPAALRRLHGVPPPVALPQAGTAAPRRLPVPAPTALDAVLDSRETCRDFDRGQVLPLPDFSRLMHRVFAARACVQAAPDFEVMKRSSPSGGALHPTEAYLLVRGVEGVTPGLHHYQPLRHALSPLAAGAWEGDLDRLARTMVCDQDYFADAQVLVVLAPRFARNFWKYRNHAKAYRVCILDVGHLSQTLLLSAAEQGLGAFVTAAINEVDIERAFGLTGYVDGPLAVCGFGVRRAAAISR